MWHHGESVILKFIRFNFLPNRNKWLDISLKLVIYYYGYVGVILILALHPVVLMEIQYHQYITIQNIKNQTQLLE